MSSGDESPAKIPVTLGKEAPPQSAAGPAWVVVPARIVALIVVLPLRVVHDLVVLAARGVRAGWNALMRIPGRIGRLIGAVLRALLAPAGRVLWLLVVRPVRWLAVVVVLGFLGWLYRVLLVPIGRFLALVGRGLGRLGNLLIVRPLRALLAITGRAIGLLFAGIALLVGVLVVLPAVFLWRYVLWPPLLALAWVARLIWAGLCRLGRGTLLVLGAFAAGVVWSWRLLGRFLGWLAHVLVVVPAGVVWRYLLSPVVSGVRGTWRLAARLLRWLWRTLVVVPARVLVVEPARWVSASVLRPLGRGVREAWRMSVRDPVRAARRTMRDAGRDVRLQLRRTFRGR